METLIYNSKPIEIADDGICKYATFLISVLNEYDRMDRKIPLEAGEKYHDTLRGFPIVAKLIKDRTNRPLDYGAHEMRQWKKRNGEIATTFGTYPIGSVIDTWIEDRVVDGYGEEAKPCLMAKAKLWTCRSPEYFTVFDRLWNENKINSSWEMITSDVEEEPSGKRILKAFSFIGNALLGTTSVPAVGGAGVYEYAEVTDENQCQVSEELSEALLKDIENFKEQEEKPLAEETFKETIEEEVSTEASSAAVTEAEATSVAEVADNAAAESAESDIKVDNISTEETLEEAQCETEDNQKKETAEETDVIASEQTEQIDDTPAELVEEPCDLNAKVEELSSALIQANDKIQELQATIDALIPFKAQVEQIEQEKAAAEKAKAVQELRSTAISSGWISEREIAEDESISAMIANADVNGINAIIVKRLTASLNSGKKFHIAETINTTLKADISAEESTISHSNIVAEFIKG